MAQSYDTIQSPAGGELIEKRSRFIGRIYPVKSEEDVQGTLKDIRSTNRDASHTCYAFVLRNGAMRCSDDGEPQGTAGVPILEVIKREGLVDVMVAVTRYFGGTLLGAGGLVRAYSHTAKLALDAGIRVTMCLCALFMLECPYPLYEQSRLLLEKHGAMILNTSFGADVTMEIRMKACDLPAFEDALRELSNGRMEAVLIGEDFSGMEITIGS